MPFEINLLGQAIVVRSEKIANMVAANKQWHRQLASGHVALWEFVRNEGEALRGFHMICGDAAVEKYSAAGWSTFCLAWKQQG